MSGACWHELFENQVTQTPEGIAVACAEQTLTYRDLNERANRLAHYLIALGVGPESLVGLSLRRSPELIVGLVGILKAGAAYVPLPPDHPPKRLAHIVRDSRMQVVVTQRDLAQHFHGLRIVCLDADRAELAGQSDANPVGEVRPNNLFYVIYTSGSTGAPKGVTMERHAVVTHCLDFAARFGLCSADRVLQFAPLSFDVSVEEILPTLMTGGRVVLQPLLAMASPGEFHAFVCQQQITVLNLPTSFWNEWMKAIERHSWELPASLRLMIAGSETVTPRQVARWRKLAGNRIRWCNAYGTTETTITSTIYEPDGDTMAANVPIGRPIGNTQIYLLNKRGRPVPDGEPGEIYIGGDKVARGYLHRPDLTAAHFVPDPFSTDPGARMSRTGDWARRRADGNLEFLGRQDEQVNLRGFRIESGEIEAALLAIPEVSEVVVVAWGTGADKRLVAYVVMAESAHVQPDVLPASEIRRSLKQKLPAYMIPASFVVMDALPRHPNGKIDRQALPDPGWQRPALDEELVSPANHLEATLVAIWRDVLGLDVVGVEDDFFDLGGHSLQAARVVTAANAHTGGKLPMRALYESRTIRRLAERLKQAEPIRPATSVVAVQPKGSRRPLFLVHGAGGGMMWGYANLARHLGPDQPLYCFQSRGLEGLTEFERIEDMAGQYVADLRACQPEGPYFLGGYCFGGEVAFEMAQQLQAQGQQVKLLALFNALPPNSSFEKVRLTPVFAGRFIVNSWRWLRYFLQWPAQARRSFFSRNIRRVKTRLMGVIQRRNKSSETREASERIDVTLYSETQRELWDTHLRASSRYQPRPYTGNVAVFRTPIYPFFCSFDPTFGWGEFVRETLAVKILPGAHESILDEPNVRGVAQELAACLHDFKRAANGEILAFDTEEGSLYVKRTCVGIS